jgi:hypothetical protein
MLDRFLPPGAGAVDRGRTEWHGRDLDVLEAVRGVERHRAIVDERGAALVVPGQGRMREQCGRVGEDDEHFGGGTVPEALNLAERETTVQFQDFG